MMFLAHFSHTPLFAIYEMDIRDINYWYNEAIKLHNKMNPAPK